jgi:hypothetical protein
MTLEFIKPYFYSGGSKDSRLIGAELYNETQYNVGDRIEAKIFNGHYKIKIMPYVYSSGIIPAEYVKEVDPVLETVVVVKEPSFWGGIKLPPDFDWRNIHLNTNPDEVPPPRFINTEKPTNINPPTANLNLKYIITRDTNLNRTDLSKKDLWGDVGVVEVVGKLAKGEIIEVVDKGYAGGRGIVSHRTLFLANGNWIMEYDAELYTSTMQVTTQDERLRTMVMPMQQQPVKASASNITEGNLVTAVLVGGLIFGSLKLFKFI